MYRILSMFGARCDWAVFKKEANGGVPVSTLEMKENDMDEHWNIYYVSKKKMGRIHAHQLDVRFIKGHLLPPNSMNTPDHTNSSQSQDFKRWLEYVFKFDSVNGMFDRNLFYMHGMVLGSIGTPKELKKWFETGAKLETKSTVVIISMIRKGWTNAQIMAENPTFFFHNQKKIEQFRSEYNRSIQLARPKHLKPCAIPENAHGSQKVVLKWWNRTVVQDEVKKGSGWLHIFGLSNSLKSWFVAHTFSALTKCASLEFKEKNFPSGFSENKYHGFIVDGFNKKTIKQGFTRQIMEHATVGRDDYFRIPRKYAVTAPRTRGEWWITIGNDRMCNLVDADVYYTIVRNRVCEVQFDLERTNPVALANMIRHSNGMRAIGAPVVIVPDSYFLSQQQQNDDNIGHGTNEAIAIISGLGGIHVGVLDDMDEDEDIGTYHNDKEEMDPPTESD
eukprot:278376_1